MVELLFDFVFLENNYKNEKKRYLRLKNQKNTKIKKNYTNNGK